MLLTSVICQFFLPLPVCPSSNDPSFSPLERGRISHGFKTHWVCVINLPIIFFLFFYFLYIYIYIYIFKIASCFKDQIWSIFKKIDTFRLNFFFLGYITHCSCWAFQIYVSFQQIPTNPAGLIEYRAHPFWIQKYCPFHEHDNTPRCCSCERMEVGD